MNSFLNSSMNMQTVTLGRFRSIQAELQTHTNSMESELIYSYPQDSAANSILALSLGPANSVYIARQGFYGDRDVTSDSLTASPRNRWECAGELQGCHNSWKAGQFCPQAGKRIKAGHHAAFAISVTASGAHAPLLCSTRRCYAE